MRDIGMPAASGDFARRCTIWRDGGREWLALVAVFVVIAAGAGNGGCNDAPQAVGESLVHPVLDVGPSTVNFGHGGSAGLLVVGEEFHHFGAGVAAALAAPGAGGARAARGRGGGNGGAGRANPLRGALGGHGFRGRARPSEKVDREPSGLYGIYMV